MKQASSRIKILVSEGHRIIVLDGSIFIGNRGMFFLKAVALYIFNEVERLTRVHILGVYRHNF